MTACSSYSVAVVDPGDTEFGAVPDDVRRAATRWRACFVGELDVANLFGAVVVDTSEVQLGEGSIARFGPHDAVARAGRCEVGHAGVAGGMGEANFAARLDRDLVDLAVAVVVELVADFGRRLAIGGADESPVDACEAPLRTHAVTIGVTQRIDAGIALVDLTVAVIVAAVTRLDRFVHRFVHRLVDRAVVVVVDAIAEFVIGLVVARADELADGVAADLALVAGARLAGLAVVADAGRALVYVTVVVETVADIVARPHLGHAAGGAAAAGRHAGRADARESGVAFDANLVDLGALVDRTVAVVVEVVADLIGGRLAPSTSQLTVDASRLVVGAHSELAGCARDVGTGDALVDRTVAVVDAWIDTSAVATRLAPGAFDLGARIDAVAFAAGFSVGAFVELTRIGARTEPAGLVGVAGGVLVRLAVAVVVGAVAVIGGQRIAGAACVAHVVVDHAIAIIVASVADLGLRHGVGQARGLSVDADDRAPRALAPIARRASLRVVGGVFVDGAVAVVVEAVTEFGARLHVADADEGATGASLGAGGTDTGRVGVAGVARGHILVDTAIAVIVEAVADLGIRLAVAEIAGVAESVACARNNATSPPSVPAYGPPADATGGRL